MLGLLIMKTENNIKKEQLQKKRRNIFFGKNNILHCNPKIKERFHCAIKTAGTVLAAALMAGSSVYFSEDSFTDINSSGSRTISPKIKSIIEQCFAPKSIEVPGKGSNYQVVRYDEDTLKINKEKISQNGFYSLAGFTSYDMKIKNHAYAYDPAGMNKNEIKAAQKLVKKYNGRRLKMSNMLHEAKHYYNYLKGIRGYGVDAEQLAQLLIHDEISANITQLIDYRNEYLETGKIDAIPDEYAFYKEALKAKKIKPSKEDIPAEEMQLVMNGMRDYWMAKNSEYYAKNHSLLIRSWLYFGYQKNKKRNDKEYNRRLGICYTFQVNGKIYNFAQAMDKDVEANGQVKKSISEYYSMPKHKRMQAWLKLIHISRKLGNNKLVKSSSSQYYAKAPKKSDIIPSYNPPGFNAEQPLPGSMLTHIRQRSFKTR